MAEFKLGRIRFVWKNTWAGSTTYIKDDVVRYGGKTYVCILGHTSTSNFYTDLTANWNLASDGQAWLGNWAGTTTYKIGDTVKYGGTVYICNLGHTSQATLEADVAKWDTFASAFDWKDAWAIATVYKVDVLASWNFKHIVNIIRIRGYNSVNLKLGYPVLEIRPPNQIIDYEN
jgi:hypothetical protein